MVMKSKIVKRNSPKTIDFKAGDLVFQKNDIDHILLVTSVYNGEGDDEYTLYEMVTIASTNLILPIGKMHEIDEEIDNFELFYGEIKMTQ